MASFQVFGGALVFKEVRVLANVGGKGNPPSPLFSSGRSLVSGILRRSEKAAEQISGFGRAIRQDPSCGGRGNR